MRTQRSRPSAVVVGGGIGGLTAALFLQRAGLRVQAVERRTAVFEVNTGILLWPFAARRLAELGLEPKLHGIGSPVLRLVHVDPSGEMLASWDLSRMAERAGAAIWDVHRSGLVRVLSEALDEGALVLGADCVGVELARTAATAVCRGGTTFTGDVVIGADGVHSTVRSQIAPDVPLARDEIVVWRGVADVGEDVVPAGLHLRVMGPGRLFGVGRLAGEQVRWYAGDTRPAGTSARTAADEVLARFGDGCEPVGRILAATDPRDVLVNDTPHARPFRPWGRDRLTLLGDAAHPTLPTLATGGGMAIEDAAALCEALAASHGDPQATLRGYERERRSAAARLHYATAAVARLLAIRRPRAVALRAGAFGATPHRAARRLLEVAMAGG